MITSVMIVAMMILALALKYALRVVALWEEVQVRRGHEEVMERELRALEDEHYNSELMLKMYQFEYSWLLTAYKEATGEEFKS
jgi:hypothetical protein